MKKNKSKYEIAYSQCPKWWKKLTFKHRRDEVQFAIDQLEAAKKPYAIEDIGEGEVILWTAPHKS